MRKIQSLTRRNLATRMMTKMASFEDSGGGFFLICAVKISGPYLFIPCKISVKMFLFYKLKKGFLHSVDTPNAFGGVKTLMFLENLFDEY